MDHVIAGRTFGRRALLVTPLSSLGHGLFRLGESKSERIDLRFADVKVDYESVVYEGIGSASWEHRGGWKTPLHT